MGLILADGIFDSRLGAIGPSIDSENSLMPNTLF